MRSWYEMNKRKTSKLGLFVIIGFFVYFAYVFIDQQKVLYAKEIEMNSIQMKIEEETKLNKELKKQKEMLGSDEYVEKIAREKLGMVKPGERIFVDINK